MAKAARGTTERVIRETTVTLTLSEDEASALAVVMSRIGGDPETTSRKFVRPIYDALRGAGIHWNDSGMSFAGYMTGE